MKTTESIRNEYLKYADELGEAEIDRIRTEVKMAELLERAYWLLTTAVERETVDDWQEKKFSFRRDFERFQNQEQK